MEGAYVVVLVYFYRFDLLHPCVCMYCCEVYPHLNHHKTASHEGNDEALSQESYNDLGGVSLRITCIFFFKVKVTVREVVMAQIFILFFYYNCT